jgi:hypothetical protein
MTERPGFWHGVFAGFAGVLVVGQLILAMTAPDLRGMYQDFSPGGSLPVLTRLTIHPAFIWGAPLVGIAAVVALLARRPRLIAPYVVVAVVLVGIAVASWYFPRAPIYELAGRIDAG